MAVRKSFNFGRSKMTVASMLTMPYSFAGGKLLGVLQKLKTVGAPPLRGGIREMHADVAQGKTAEDSIGNGVRENVGIGMTGKTERSRNGDATQNEGTARFNAMRVPSLPDSKSRLHYSFRPAVSRDR